MIINLDKQSSEQVDMGAVNRLIDNHDRVFFHSNFFNSHRFISSFSSSSSSNDRMITCIDCQAELGRFEETMRRGHAILPCFEQYVFKKVDSEPALSRNVKSTGQKGEEKLKFIMNSKSSHFAYKSKYEMSVVSGDFCTCELKFLDSK
jgi:hypothetical protein